MLTTSQEKLDTQTPASPELKSWFSHHLKVGALKPMASVNPKPPSLPHPPSSRHSRRIHTADVCGLIPTVPHCHYGQCCHCINSVNLHNAIVFPVINDLARAIWRWTEKKDSKQRSASREIWMGQRRPVHAKPDFNWLSGPQKWNLKEHMWYQYQLSPFPSSSAAIEAAKRLMRLLLAANNQATRRNETIKSYLQLGSSSNRYAPRLPQQEQNHLQNSFLRRTQFWVWKTFFRKGTQKWTLLDRKWWGAGEPQILRNWWIRFQSTTSDGITARSISVILRLKNR